MEDMGCPFFEAMVLVSFDTCTATAGRKGNQKKTQKVRGVQHTSSSPPSAHNTRLYTPSSPSSLAPLLPPPPPPHPPLQQQPKPVKPSPHPLSSTPSPPTAVETRSPAGPSSPASHAGDVSVPPSASEDLPRRSRQGSRGRARFPAPSVAGGTGRSAVAIGRSACGAARIGRRSFRAGGRGWVRCRWDMGG